MIRRPIIIAVMMVIAAFAVSCGTDGRDDTTAYSQALQSMIETRWNQYRSGKPNWAGGIAFCLFSPRGGYFSSAGFDQEVTEGLHFRGASTTKTFTAAAILLLHQQGRLNIDDHITEIMPDKSDPYVPTDARYDIPFKSQITIRQLLSHRAGVFDVSNDPIPSGASASYAGKYYINYAKDELNQPLHSFSFDELVGVLADNQLYYTAPDTEFHYSNTGYSILGKIIERVSGQSYRDFIQTRFLDPLNLADTTFPDQGDQTGLPAPFANGYLYYQDRLYGVTEDNMSPHAAEGNIITTFYDLAVWIRALMKGEAGLTAATVRMMMEVTPASEQYGYYGLGCIYTPGLGYGHNGGHPGYLTVVRFDPDLDLTLVIACSVLEAENLENQLAFLYDIGFSARQILGYP